MKKNEKNPFFLWKKGPLEAAETQYTPTGHHWWDAQSKQSQQTYRQSIQTTRRQFTKRWKRIIRPRKHRDQGVEKHSCQIELRGAHLNLVYYNGKQLLRAYSMVHVTAVLHVRNEDELADTYTYMLRWYIWIYIHTHVYIYIYTHTHTHILLNTVSMN